MADKLMSVYEDSANIPEGLSDYYEEVGGKYLLSVEGIKTEGDVEKLKRALNSEREVVRNLREQMNNGNPGTPVPPAEPDIPIAATDVQIRKKMEILEKKINEYEKTDRQRTIQDSLKKAASSAGVTGTAIEDILMYSDRNFGISEDGSILTTGNDGGQTPEEWISSMKTSRPHWWGTSSGGGSHPGNGRSVPRNMPNPFAKDSLNLTEQARIYRENPELAMKMKSRAT